MRCPVKERKLRVYDKEFKLNAVKLYLKGGGTYQQVGERLGVPATTLIGWVYAHKKAGARAFPGKGNIKESDIEVTQLRKRLLIAEEERDILKKALGIFSLRQK
jgi:transposase-like protein